MGDFVIGIVLLLIVISPFILYQLEKKKMSYTNIFVVALCICNWLYIIFAGIPYGLNISTFMWLTSLFIALFFLVLCGIQVFYKIYPGFSKYVLSVIILAVIGTSIFIFSKFYSEKDISAILDIGMLYTVPLFLISLFLIGISPLNKIK